MAGKSSKDKGKRVERELCVIMESTFGGSWTRTAFSGAFTGGTNAHRKQILSANQIKGYKADIYTPDEFSKLVIECKGYSDFAFHQLLSEDGNQLLDGWIRDLENDCDDGDIGLLCLKVNRIGWFVFVSENHHFEMNNFVAYKKYRGTRLNEFLDINKQMILELLK